MTNIVWHIELSEYDEYCLAGTYIIGEPRPSTAIGWSYTSETTSNTTQEEKKRLRLVVQTSL